MTLSFWQRRLRDADFVCDLAVVGGGIVGTSAAYWLARETGREVVLVEATRLAHGASGRNAGFVLPGGARDYFTDRATYGADRTRRLWAFTRESRDLLASELRPRAFGFEASGGLVVAGSEEEDARLRASVGPMRADGAPTAYIPRDETARRLLAQGFGGALYLASAATVDPAALVRHLGEASGARVLEGHPVAALEARDGRIAIETPHRTILAGRVVVALGAYLPRLVPELGRFVRPVRAQMLATAPLEPRWLDVPVYTHQGYYYLRQLADGTLLVGGARHLHIEAEVGYEDATTPALQADLERYLHLHFPQTRGLAVRQRWSGTMGFAPDHLPVVGAVPGLPGAWFATGCTGHGMAYGFRLGRLLAALATGEDRPEGYDLFAAERFEGVAAG